MLGIGWGEMLVIAVVALVVVGPKDLPVLLRNLGRMMGAVRRMSNDFRREIDKAIAAEEIREARKAISDPLRQTTDEIRREFNAIGKDGKVEPSGKIKPSEPGKESVADEIRAKAGLAPAKPVEPSPAAAAMTAQVKASVETVKAKPAPRKAAAEKPGASKAAPKTKASAAPPADEPAKPRRRTARKKAAQPVSDAGEN